MDIFNRIYDVIVVVVIVDLNSDYNIRVCI